MRDVIASAAVSVTMTMTIAMLVTGCTALRADPSAYSTVYQSAWRDGVDRRLDVQAPNAGSITMVSVPQFQGAALKVSILPSDDFRKVANGTPRAEIAFGPVAKFDARKEYKISWSTMIPVDARLDFQQPEIISQMHQSMPTGSPPFSLMLDRGQYRVDVYGGPGTKTESFMFGTPVADKGRVVRWTLLYRADSTGERAVTDLLQNGSVVVHAPGRPNAYPNDTAAYWKIGLYKWWWLTRPSDVTSRTLYFGDVRIEARPASRE